MITDLDLLLHHLEGELEQGDEVSHLHDGGVAPPPSCCKGVLEPETCDPSPTENSTQKVEYRYEEEGTLICSCKDLLLMTFIILDWLKGASMATFM